MDRRRKRKGLIDVKLCTNFEHLPKNLSKEEMKNILEKAAGDIFKCLTSTDEEIDFTKLDP
jgi:hypothetical protein